MQCGEYDNLATLLGVEHHAEPQCIERRRRGRSAQRRVRVGVAVSEKKCLWIFVCGRRRLRRRLLPSHPPPPVAVRRKKKNTIFTYFAVTCRRRFGGILNSRIILTFLRIGGPDRCVEERTGVQQVEEGVGSVEGRVEWWQVDRKGIEQEEKRREILKTREIIYV